MKQTRRDVLRLGVGAGVTALAGCGALSGTQSSQSSQSESNSSGAPNDSQSADQERSTTGTREFKTSPTVDVRGAIYMPARAWNNYQMYANYDPTIIERDFGYAKRVNLNAIRTWLNYEFWEEDPQAAEKHFEHLLTAADDRGIRVLVTLFDGVGIAPTEENLTNTDPMNATTISSPSMPVVKDRSRWDKPREYLRWVLERYGDDDRILGLELMNEPGWIPAKVRFCEAMFKTMRRNRGSVPLTVGSTSIVNDLDYRDWGADILQFHYNFPNSRDRFDDALRQAAIVRDQVDQPVWLTEWQRIRSGRGFHSAPAPDERGPNYSSMAPIIQEHQFGNFFWSLMVKPAAVTSQRKHGILNGLFHEDGAVWDIQDAKALKAMSGDASFEGRERKEWPEWAKVIKKKVDGAAG